MSAGLDALIATLTPDGDRAFTARVDEGWMQGRTTYGGASSALALAAARRAFPSDFPFRSAQIAFVGPVGGDCRLRVEPLRESGGSLSLSVDVTSDLGFGTRMIATFAKQRASQLDERVAPLGAVPGPEEIEPLPPHPMRPAFTRQLDMRSPGGIEAFLADPGRIAAWVRPVDPATVDPATLLLAVGDALPPAALTQLSAPGPMSSVNWSVHMLTPEPTTDDGWWFLTSQSHHAQGGYSVQSMAMFNRAGEPIALSTQGVAIFA